MNQSKKLTEGAIFTTIYLILMVLSLLPVVYLFVFILLPVPFVLYTARHGVKSGAIMFILASILTVIFFTPLSLPFTVMMGIGGMLVGHAIHKKRSAYETWAYGTLGFIGGILFTVAFSQLLFGINLMQEIETFATEQMKWYISLIEGFGIETTSEMDLETVLTQQIQLYMNLVPAMIAISAVFIALLVQWISYKIMNRIDNKDYRFPPFRNLKLPTSIIWLYLMVIIASFFDLDPNGMMFTGVQNALFILEMLLVVQGFSFIFFFTHYKKMSKAIPILSIVLTVLFPIILLYFVRILGIIDIGLNLRERLQKNK